MTNLVARVKVRGKRETASYENRFAHDELATRGKVEFPAMHDMKIDAAWRNIAGARGVKRTSSSQPCRSHSIFITPPLSKSVNLQEVT